MTTSKHVWRASFDSKMRRVNEEQPGLHRGRIRTRPRCGSQSFRRAGSLIENPVRDPAGVETLPDRKSRQTAPDDADACFCAVRFAYGDSVVKSRRSCDGETARESYETALAIHREVGNRRFQGIELSGLGSLPSVRGYSVKE